jgi:hypothetical protein
MDSKPGGSGRGYGGGRNGGGGRGGNGDGNFGLPAPAHTGIVGNREATMVDEEAEEELARHLLLMHLSSSIMASSDLPPAIHSSGVDDVDDEGRHVARRRLSEHERSREIVRIIDDNILERIDDDEDVEEEQSGSSEVERLDAKESRRPYPSGGPGGV